MLTGAMPEDHELYYGFTRFAIELNELDQEQAHLYAPTDTRFRPDQRYKLQQCFRVHDSIVELTSILIVIDVHGLKCYCIAKHIYLFP